MPRQIAILTALSLLAATLPADSRPAGNTGGAVPKLNIAAGCKDLSTKEISRSINLDRCMTEEKIARDQLQGTWSKFPAGDKDLCMYLVTPPALPSYVTLQGCLDMARDAKNIGKGQGSGISGTPQSQ
jgi:hypothetical protein